MTFRFEVGLALAFLFLFCCFALPLGLLFWVFCLCCLVFWPLCCWLFLVLSPTTCTHLRWGRVVGLWTGPFFRFAAWFQAFSSFRLAEG